MIIKASALLEEAEARRTARLFGVPQDDGARTDDAFRAVLAEQLQLRANASPQAEFAQLAELLVAEYYLDAGSSTRAMLPVAELAASLFATAGYTSRARALRRQFGGWSQNVSLPQGRSAIESLRLLARGAYALISSRQLEPLPAYAFQLARLSEDEALELELRRYAALLSRTISDTVEIACTPKASALISRFKASFELLEL